MEIKIGNKTIKTYGFEVSENYNKIYIQCELESYEIFKEWLIISSAHKRSSQYSKSNICKDIIKDDHIYHGCQVLDCQTMCYPLTYKVTILYDYTTIVGRDGLNILNAQETTDRLNNLFNF